MAQEGKLSKDQYSHETNKYINEYIKFADTKAATLLTFLGVSLGATFSLLKHTLNKINELTTPNLDIVFIVILGIVLFLITLFSIKAINSIFLTIKPNYEKTDKSLNSFPDLSEMKFDDYVKALEELDDSNTAYKEYAKHNIQLSKISMSKYSNLEDAISSFKIFIYTLVALFLISVIVNSLRVFNF